MTTRTEHRDGGDAAAPPPPPPPPSDAELRAKYGAAMATPKLIARDVQRFDSADWAMRQQRERNGRAQATTTTTGGATDGGAPASSG